MILSNKACCFGTYIIYYCVLGYDCHYPTIFIVALLVADAIHSSVCILFTYKYVLKYLSMVIRMGMYPKVSCQANYHRKTRC